MTEPPDATSEVLRQSGGVSRDVSEQKRAESVQQTTLQRFYAVLSSIRRA